MTQGLLIIGAGKLARCIQDAAEAAGCPIWGFADNISGTETSLNGYPVLAENDILEGRLPPPKQAIIAVGDNWIRNKVAGRYRARFPSLVFASITHPRACLSPSATLGEGCLLLAGAVVNPHAVLGSHVMLWSNAVVEHDCRLDDYVTLAPSATIAGSVHIGKRSFLGTGASVSHDVAIGADVVVGTGTVVVRDLDSEAVYVGNPARRLRDRRPGDAYL